MFDNITSLYNVSFNPISNHDLLKFTFERRNKSRLVDGKWQKCLEEFEDWIKTYVIK